MVNSSSKRCQHYTMGNGAGTTEYLHAEEWYYITHKNQQKTD